MTTNRPTRMYNDDSHRDPVGFARYMQATHSH